MLKLKTIKTLETSSEFSDLLTKYAVFKDMYLLLKVDKELIKQLKKDAKELGYAKDTVENLLKLIDQLEAGKTYHVWEFIDEVEEVEVEENE